MQKNYKAATLIFFFLLAIIVPIEPIRCAFPNQTSTIFGSKLFSKQASPEKKQRWLEMEKEVSSWGDALGMSIDPGIKNAVIALNLLSLKTSASCEGHIDRGLAYPWVDFNTENKQIQELNKKVEIINQSMDEKESEIRNKYPHLSHGEALRQEESEVLNAIYKERRELNQKIEVTSRSQLISLKQLLDNFYRRRPSAPDRMIIIHELNPTFLRMYSIGGDWQIVRNNAERTKKLREYQEEMKQFADYLRNYFFSK